MADPAEPGEATAQAPEETGQPALPGGEPAAEPAAETPKAKRASPAKDKTTGDLRSYAKELEAEKKRRAPANADELAAAVGEAQEELRRAGTSPLFSRDPYRLVLSATSITLGVFPKFVRRLDGALSGVVVELGRLVDAVRHPLTETERAALKRDMVEATRAAAGAAAAEIAAGARAQDRRSLAVAFAGGMVALSVAGVGCYALGRGSGRAEAEARAAAWRMEMEVAQQRVALPPAQAQTWLRLILANPDIVAAVQQSRRLPSAADGRRAGAVPMYLDPPGVPGLQARR